MIEEVKKILNEELNPKSPYCPDGDYYPVYDGEDITKVAQQICQLIEPKADKAIKSERKRIGKWLIEDCDEIRDTNTNEIEYYGVKPEQAEALKQGEKED